MRNVILVRKGNQLEEGDENLNTSFNSGGDSSFMEIVNANSLPEPKRQCMLTKSRAKATLNPQ